MRDDIAPLKTMSYFSNGSMVRQYREPMDPRSCFGPSQVSFAVHVYFHAMNVVVLGIAADVEARGLEILAVNVNPRIPRGVLGLAEDVGTVVNAVEVDRLAVVAFPCAVRWRGEADHRGQRRPAINVRHHLVVLRARR